MNVFVIVGASGSGKTTIARKLEQAGEWIECKSHTTRPMRKGEINGKDYYFISEHNFDEMLNRNLFAEYVEYDGNKYGIAKGEIDTTITKGRNCFIIANYDGFKQIKEIYPNLKSVFIDAELGECVIRMAGRGDGKGQILNRVAKYNKEVSVKSEFDIIIKNVNGQLEDSVQKLSGFIKGCSLKDKTHV